MQSVIYDEESCSQSDSISLGSSLPAVSASGIEVIEKTTQQPRQPLPEEQKRHISKKITEAQKLIKFYDELKSNKVEFKGTKSAKTFTFTPMDNCLDEEEEEL